jgi:hypothetical protein
MTAPAPAALNYSMPLTRTDRRPLRSLAIFGLYLAIALIYFARGLAAHPGNWYLGRDTDPGQTMWFFNWWRFASAHRLNPFVTDWVWAPLGINLAWTTFVPLPAWFSIPLQLTVGEPATYNIVVMLMLPLAALAAFVLCQRVTGGAFWPSVLGGYIFGFSPHMLGEVLGHLVVIAVFPVPLIALITLRRLDGEISAARFTVMLALLLVTEFLCSVDIFATMTLVGGFSLLLALLIFDGNTSIRLKGLIGPIALGYVISTAVLSPYFYYLLALGHPSGSIWPPSKFSADLVGFLVPRQTIWWGSTNCVTAISRRFAGTIMENGDYLGIALIVFVEIFRRRFWPMPIGKFLTLLLLAIIVAAFGPTLHVAGVEGFPMPWTIFQHFPFIADILPVRFMMYSFLVIGVMIAMWFSASPARPRTKIMASAILVASIAPNLDAAFWVSKIELPPFFANGSYAKELSPREIILPLPWAQKGNSMYWQLESAMYFRMAGGWTGVSPFEFDRMPIVNFFQGETDLPEAGDQLKAYIARFAVTAIVADPSEGHLRTIQPVLESLGVAADQAGGVLLYKIPAGKFAPYAKLSSAEIETRALTLRFDTILAAAENYIAGGNDLLKLSPLELKRLNLLPPDWQIDTAPNSLRDWSIGGFTDHRIAIVLLGSAQGMKPLLDRYFGRVDELDYPAPSRWTPATSPSQDRMDKMLMVLDHTQLETAAAQLKSSPPPEMTTPFLGAADSH